MDVESTAKKSTVNMLFFSVAFYQCLCASQSAMSAPECLIPDFWLSLMNIITLSLKALVGSWTLLNSLLFKRLNLLCFV